MVESHGDPPISNTYRFFSGVTKRMSNRVTIDCLLSSPMYTNRAMSAARWLRRWCQQEAAQSTDISIMYAEKERMWSQARTQQIAYCQSCRCWRCCCGTRRTLGTGESIGWKDQVTRFLYPLIIIVSAIRLCWDHGLAGYTHCVVISQLCASSVVIC